MTSGDLPYSELVRAAVSKIPSVFGRLSYVASFRDAGSGLYTHGDEPGTPEARETDEVLLKAHQEVFNAWLCLSLEEQAADLAEYLWKLLPDQGQPLRKWMQEVPYLQLIPRGALQAQQQLFRSDLELVLRIFHDQAS